MEITSTQQVILKACLPGFDKKISEVVENIGILYPDIDSAIEVLKKDQIDQAFNYLYLANDIESQLKLISSAGLPLVPGTIFISGEIKYIIDHFEYLRQFPKNRIIGLVFFSMK